MINAIFIYLDALAPLLLLIFLLNYNRSVMPKELLPLLFFLAIQFILNTIADILSFYSLSFYSFNSNSIYHVNLPLSLIAQLYFFKASGAKIFFTHSLFVLGIILTVVVVINSFSLENIYTFNGISYALKCVYVLFICLRYYWYKLNSEDSSDIIHQPSFWFMSGFFIYYCSCFVIFAAFNILVIHNDQLTILARQYQDLMYLIMCIMLAKGIKQTAYAQ